MLAKLSTHKATAILVLCCLSGFFYQVVLDPSSLLFPDSEALLKAGANFGPLTIGQKQYWRLASAIFLHWGLLHITLNLLVLVSFGPLVEDSLGKWRYIFVFLFSALAGNLLSIYANPLNTSIGASGGIIGIIAALMVVSWLKRAGHSSRLTRPQLVFLAASLVYSFILGLTSTITDNACHLGGFLAGALAGLILTGKSSGRARLIASVPARMLALMAIVPVLFALVAARTDGDKTVKAYVEQQEGIKLLKEKKYLHGLDHLNAALALSPENPSVRQDRARALIELDQADDALKDLALVIAKRPKDYIPLMTRAGAYHKLKQDNLALEDLNKAIELAPREAILYNNRAWFKLAQQDNSALSDCNKAMELRRDLATIYDTRGLAYYLQGNYTLADRDLTLAIKKDGKDGAYYYHRALVKLALHDPQAQKDIDLAQTLTYKPEAWEPKLSDLTASESKESNSARSSDADTEKKKNSDSPTSVDASTAK